MCGFPISWKSAGSFLDESCAHHIYAVIEIPSDSKSSNLFDLRETDERGRMRGKRMTRKPRRHALGVPARSGSERRPSEPGEVH